MVREKEEKQSAATVTPSAAAASDNCFVKAAIVAFFFLVQQQQQQQQRQQQQQQQQQWSEKRSGEIDIESEKQSGKSTLLFNLLVQSRVRTYEHVLCQTKGPLDQTRPCNSRGGRHHHTNQVWSTVFVFSINCPCGSTCIQRPTSSGCPGHA